MNPFDVVSNTSPLIFLEKIDSLPLLKHCFQNVFISEVVVQEWGINHLPDFIQVQSLSEVGKSFVQGAIGRLHKGELEAIRLAKELHCERILLDDLSARRYSERQGLIPIGTLGILKLANELDLLPLQELKKNVENLITHHDLFISTKFLKEYWDSFKS